MVRGEKPRFRCTSLVKKGATLLITRSSGESFEVVQTIAEEFIEIFLDAFLKGLVKG